jgi:hypothetical protein
LTLIHTRRTPNPDIPIIAAPDAIKLTSAREGLVMPPTSPACQKKRALDPFSYRKFRKASTTNKRAQMSRVLLGLFCLFLPMSSISFAEAQDQLAGQLTARVLAVGIPGASAVAPIGTFHKGRPIHDKPEFAAFTQPRQILDPRRILVASHSNFGAPLAQLDAAEGAVLSLDPDGPTLVIPKQFATSGKQAHALDGRVQLFTAQSPEFLNRIHTPGATSAAYPSVSNPIGISINKRLRPTMVFQHALWAAADRDGIDC